ncbi:MAG: zinc-ribbon domain-containing protein [Phycisphaeraceae bacterium]|nr:MAG: zinc-ribbon domain-containing protein [Phycisphaeraceae bacterium]
MGRGSTRPDECPSAEDVARFGGDTLPCPECGTHLYDEAEFCHSCGHVMPHVKEAKGPPVYVVVLVGLLVVGLVVGGLFF